MSGFSQDFNFDEKTNSFGWNPQFRLPEDGFATRLPAAVAG
jgi:hypothetical protein